MPVNTFRGLLQILFLPHKNPLYETRVLVANNKITLIKNKKFVQIPYNYEHAKSFMNTGKIRLCKNYSKAKIDRLIGRKMILGFMDCKMLEI